MSKNDVKKGYVVGIMMLLAAVSVVPNLNGTSEQISKTGTGSRQAFFGGPPDILWNKTFGGSNSDDGIKIITTADKGLAILGRTSSFDAGHPDFWLLKTDSNGVEQWNHTYGNDLDDFSMDVQQTSDGGYIMVGYFFFFQSHNVGVRLVKTDSNGMEEWDRTFGTVYHPADACSVYQTSDGGYLILGNNWTHSMNLSIIKTDRNGNEESETLVSCPGINAASARTDDGGFIITGYAPTDDDIDLFLMKINAAYDKEWETILGGSKIDAGLSVLQTNDDQYVACGVTNAVDGFEGGDVWIVNMDAQGHTVWSRTIGGAGTEVGNSVKETANGFIIVGRNGSYNSSDTDLLVIHTNMQGYADTVWTLGGSSWDEGHDVLVTAEDDYIITGFYSNYASDLWLLKLKGVHENVPPSPPVIDGPSSGKVGIAYPYSFISTDPDGDQVSYYIEWGDGQTTDWTAYHPSGSPGYSESHVWDKKGEYTIRAQARDTFGAESNWSTLHITRPLSYQPPHLAFFAWLFEHFPNLFPLLRRLAGY